MRELVQSADAEGGLGSSRGLWNALQIFARLEAHRLAGLDADHFSRPWVAADPGLAGLYVEHPQAPQLDAFASGQSLFHRVEHGLDGLLGLGLGNACAVNHFIHEVKLDHANLLEPLGFIVKTALTIVKFVILDYHSLVVTDEARRHDGLGLARIYFVEVKPMSVKSDRWIRRMVKEFGMIHPFAESQVREGVISCGFSSYGYDLRVADEFKICTNVNSTIVDPKHFDERSFVEFRGSVCIVPPNSFALARSVEYLKIPRSVLTICVGKSTYARCGIIVNATPLEPEWEGFVTLEISNTTPLPARGYSNEGLCQIVFFDSDEICETSYKDKKGKYQAQQGIVLPRI